MPSATRCCSSATPNLQTLEDVDHWILLRRNLSRARSGALSQAGRAGTIPGRFREVFLALPGRTGHAGRLRTLCRIAGGTLRERERRRCPKTNRSVREETIAEQREVARVYRASDRLLRERSLLTFGMQLLDAVHLLDEDPAFAATLRERYRYILVDEFQDTNIAQVELLWRLSGGARNIVAVGDNAQAIYRFRGASFGSFTIFLERFAGIPRGNSAAAAPFVRPLVDNYRSTARILRTAAQVSAFIDHSPLVPKNELVPHKADGEKVRIVEFASALEEARWIASEIERLHKAGLNWRRFAALYRIHNHRTELVSALEERGIPFVIRNLSIIDYPLVRDLVAYLRLVVNPADNIACARVLAAPAWGLEPIDVVRLCERAGKAKTPLWQAIQSPQGELPFGGHSRTTDELIAGINALRARSRTMNAAELFTAMADWLELPISIRAVDQPYVRRLAQFIREWQSKSETAALPEFVEYLNYFVQAGGQINLEQESGDAVQLMTVHAAKGLEFDQVFVLRLTHRGFPMAPRAAELEFPEALMKEELPKGDFHTQEERRLFYVAITRARERLTLTTVVNKRSRPSIFLEDILSIPQVARQNIEQTAPVLARGGNERCASAGASAFRRRAQQSAHLFAYRGVGGAIPSAGIRTAAVERFGHRNLSEVPAEIPLQLRLGLEGRS